MSSIYHIIDKVPAINQSDMQIEYEELAQSLVDSGKLRIDTDHSCNFARFTDPKVNVSRMISKQEIYDPKLVPQTRQFFKKIYGRVLSPVDFENKLALIFKDLKNQLSKLQPVSMELKLKLARLLVQSAHPIVIRWLLHDRVEVFITYSHNIGDMMDIQTWQHSGNNSGMQSTDGKNVAVFVSCGGNPFGKNNIEHPTYGDGWPSVARLQIIAAQELGHFADIRRDEKGNQIGRHSANFSGTRSYDHVKLARKNDINRCIKLFKILHDNGLKQLIEYDTRLDFYRKNKITGLKILFLKFLQSIYKYKILYFAHNNKLLFIKRFKADIYMGLMIKTMIADMQFNLSPVADVYKRDNPEEQEAIACIEALARVPQQVIKWGYLTTMELMQDLYKIYYNEVVPSLISNYELMTGEKYTRTLSKPKITFFVVLKRFFVKKNTEQLVEVRRL